MQMHELYGWLTKRTAQRPPLYIAKLAAFSFASSIRVIHIFNQITPSKRRAGGKHERWDEEWREAGRSEGLGAAAASPWPLAAPSWHQVRTSGRGLRATHTTQKQLGVSLDYFRWL